MQKKLKKVTIAEFIDKLGLSHAEIANKIGCTKQCVSAWNLNKSYPVAHNKKGMIKFMLSHGYELKEKE